MEIHSYNNTEELRISFFLQAFEKNLPIRKLFAFCLTNCRKRVSGVRFNLIIDNLSLMK